MDVAPRMFIRVLSPGVPEERDVEVRNLSLQHLAHAADGAVLEFGGRHGAHGTEQVGLFLGAVAHHDDFFERLAVFAQVDGDLSAGRLDDLCSIADIGYFQVFAVLHVDREVAVNVGHGGYGPAVHTHGGPDDRLAAAVHDLPLDDMLVRLLCFCGCGGGVSAAVRGLVVFLEQSDLLARTLVGDVRLGEQPFQHLVDVAVGGLQRNLRVEFGQEVAGVDEDVAIGLFNPVDGSLHRRVGDIQGHFQVLRAHRGGPGALCRHREQHGEGHGLDHRHAAAWRALMVFCFQWLHLCSV